MQQIKKGGASRNRQILVRCRELDSPQLFPASGIDQNNPLGLKAALPSVTPLFLLDLNVLFDIGPRRLRHDQAISLFQADRMGLCRLAISDEIHQELKRSSRERRTDPMQDFIGIFPSFPIIKHAEATNLINTLAKIIFPDKEEDELNDNDRSDLYHVATVIQNELAGLITSDESILKAREKLKSRYNIDILSPDIFMTGLQEEDNSNSIQLSDQSELYLRDVSKGEEQEIHKLLSQAGVTGSEIATGWAPPQSNQGLLNRCAAWYGNELVGYVTKILGVDGITNIRLAVNEINNYSRAAAQALLARSLENTGINGPEQIRLYVPNHQSCVREIAFGMGFFGAEEPKTLIKLVLGSVLTQENWKEEREKLVERVGIRLPEIIPSHRASSQQIEIYTPDGNKRYVALDTLESLLSPCLICMRNRPAVITPIRKNYSQELLGHSRQCSFLPDHRVSMYQTRYYFSSQNTLKHFKRGALILFYESGKDGGHSALVAIGRVVEAYHKAVDSIDSALLESSVLNDEHLVNIGSSKVKTVTVFDNIFSLPNPIPLSILRQLGCGKPNDLITTRKITDNQLQTILSRAFG